MLSFLQADRAAAAAGAEDRTRFIFKWHPGTAEANFIRVRSDELINFPSQITFKSTPPYPRRHV